MKRPTAVIFDMDGIIFDSEILVLKVWEELLPSYGVTNIREFFPDCIGRNREGTKLEFEKRYGTDFPYWEFRDHASRVYHERYDGGRLPLKPGARELLAALCEAKVPLALASSTRRSVVEEEIKSAGLWDYFRVVIGGDAVKVSKPNPEIFLLAAKALKVSPSDCYVIEDSHFGIMAAHSAGMHPLMVPDLQEATPQMRELAEQVFDDLFGVKVYFGL